MSTSSPIPGPLFRRIKTQGARHEDGHEIVLSMIDETDGSEADETIHFGLDGAEFELNLSKAHAEELRRVLEPYINAGRKTGGMRNERAPTNKDEAEPVLNGTKQHSMKVSDSGIVQRQIIGLNRRVNDDQ
jgi:Lsr2